MSKPNKFERSYRDTIAPTEGLQGIGANKTKIIRTVGMIGMNCDYCGIHYETHACWAKKSNCHFCSRACHDKSRQEPINKSCVVCKKRFTVFGLVLWERITTCSSKCKAIKRRDFMNAQVADMENSPIFNFGNHEVGMAISKKLTDEKVRLIRQDTRSQTQIAKDYGIGQVTVSNIKLRKTWKHIK